MHQLLPEILTWVLRLAIAGLVILTLIALGVDLLIIKVLKKKGIIK
ncbi:hypothetical protein M0R04_11775 [Candidatus Dojkabacteria bacterium]|jgi:hypothetical protein|nr:hypothetical protein [Candidatus Dojkabacteria bacterium]